MKKVFVSSVMREYAKFRGTAVEAIKAVNCFPIVAEDFGAQSKSPQAAYLDGVRESDVYVGILGERYSLATQEEFDEAVRTGKDLLIFVEKTRDRETEQAAFLERVEDRIEGYNRASFTNEEELKSAVIKALARLLSSTKADHKSAAQRLQKIPELIRERVGRGVRSDSWLWLAISPAVGQCILSARDFRSDRTSETVIDTAFEKDHRLFVKDFATKVGTRGDWLEIKQVNPELQGSPPVRSLLVDRFPTVAFGTIVSEEFRGFTAGLRSFYLDPEKVRENAQCFLLYCSALYRQLDPTHQISEFSYSACLTGTDNRIFESPPGHPVNSVSLPGVFSGREGELITVPDKPLEVRLNQLKEEWRGEEIRELFWIEFEKLRPKYN